MGYYETARRKKSLVRYAPRPWGMQPNTSLWRMSATTCAVSGPCQCCILYHIWGVSLISSKGSDPSVYVLLYMFASYHLPPQQFHRAHASLHKPTTQSPSFHRPRHTLHFSLFPTASNHRQFLRSHRPHAAPSKNSPFLKVALV
jgi:hypothetical protein